MALATADADGRPSVRMVLLKGHDARGFVFYTNSRSRKGGELAANPRAALLFHWKSLRRQVRIEGPVEPVSDAEADAYFATRVARFPARRLGLGPVAAAGQPRRLRGPLPGAGRAISRATKCRVRRTGGAIASCPSGSNSGPTAPTGCTSGGCSSATRRRLERKPALPMSARTAQTRASLTTRAALASVATALFLLGLKTYAAWATGSVAMLGSLADTALDVLASLVTLFGVRVAADAGRPRPSLRPRQGGSARRPGPGRDHHRLRARHRLARRRPAARTAPRPRSAEYGIAVSVVAIAATLALIAYQRSVIRRTGSVAIGTDRVHYQSDLLLNLAVIAALALDQYAGLTGADPLFGIAIAAWLLFGAWRASTHAVDQLMDKEWPEERRRRFVAVAARHPEGRGIHDLRTRSSGAHEFAQFHIWVDPADDASPRAHRGDGGDRGRAGGRISRTSRC